MALFKLHKMNKTQLVLLTLLVLIVESSIMTVSCRPNDRSDHSYKVSGEELELPTEEEEDELTPMELDGINMCEADENLMELCARCVKATKANNLYPMCCLNLDKVGDWCRDFVYFGIQ